MLVTVVTGAGVSKAAGLETYREEGSSWRLPELEKASHKSRYGNHLPLLKPHWEELSRRAREASPTTFHHLVAERGWRVITQNVDGLHTKAGSKEVIELHGRLALWGDLRGRNLFPSSSLTWSEEEGTWVSPLTGSARVRPQLVLFGEKLKEGPKALRWVRESDLVLYAGTSGQVLPVAEWYRQARTSLLVDPKPWGDFTHTYPLTAEEWAAQGGPLPPPF